MTIKTQARPAGFSMESHQEATTYGFFWVTKVTVSVLAKLVNGIPTMEVVSGVGMSRYHPTSVAYAFEDAAQAAQQILRRGAP